ncbi:MAG: flagellar hook-associated protein 3 [Lachnospiraceae bacterium]
MRITNSMITEHSKTNINSVKQMVDKYNDQMTSQKKISRPSDDPVVAIRSLRLRGTLNEVNQYYTKNIPDAESWLDVTEGSLGNMKEILRDIYKQCVNGSTDTLTAEDRNALVKNLVSLKKQLYEEGNSDCAGRTIFTGHKTDTTLTFQNVTARAKYQITQSFSISSVESKRYYADEIQVPATEAGIQGGIKLEDEMKEVQNDRIRLAYGETSGGVLPIIQAGGVPITVETKTYADWKKADFAVDPDKTLYIPETGEVVFGKNVSDKLKADALANPDMKIDITYQKQGFSKGDVKPEMYFNCKDITDAVDLNDTAHIIDYHKEAQTIDYTVSANQTLSVNTQAGEDGILSTSIGRVIDELLESVNAAISGNAKKEKIESMMKDSKYADDQSQAGLKQWLEAAQKEKTFADDNLRKLFSSGQTSFQSYQAVVDLALADTGSRDSRLKLTNTRMKSQQATVEKLISSNENREASDILLDYKSAYTAYESALSAASKANTMSLLDYL